MKIFKQAYNGSFYIEGLREFTIGGYTPTVVNGLVYITNDNTGDNILDSVPYTVITDRFGNGFNTGNPVQDQADLLDYLIETIVENKPLRIWSESKKAVTGFTTDLEFMISGLIFPPVVKLIGQNYSQTFTEDDNTLEQLSPFVWKLIGFNPGANLGQYDLEIESDSFKQTFEDQVEVITSPFIDLRLGGDALGRIETRSNYTQPVNNQNLANSGMVRDALGLRNISGFSTWSHWVKFHDVSVGALSQQTISMIIRIGSSVWMAGVMNDIPHNKTSTAQYYQAQVFAYFANNSLSSLYGGGGVANWNQGFGQTVAINPGDYIRIDFENAGSTGSLFTVYQSGPNPGDWLDTSNQLFQFVQTSPGTGLQRIPGATMRNGSEQQYIVAIGAF